MKQKIKVMKNKPVLSDEEIRSYMDFGHLLASQKTASTTRDRYFGLKYAIPLVATFGIAIWIVFFKLTHVPPPTEPLPSSPQSRVPLNTEQPNLPAAVPEKTQEGETENSQSMKSAVQADRERKELEPPRNGTEDHYVQAEPDAGYAALYDYFNAQLIYPPESVKDSIEGVQTVTFIINRDGKPEKIQVKQSLGLSFEKEARRLIENMPPWKPATLNGKAVPSQISIPLTFQIKKMKIKEPL